MGFSAALGPGLGLNQVGRLFALDMSELVNGFPADIGTTYLASRQSILALFVILEIPVCPLATRMGHSPIYKIVKRFL